MFREDYTNLVTKQQMLENKMYHIYDMNRMKLESEFIMEAYTSGYIGVLEVVTKNHGIFKKVVEMGIKFLESLSAKARQRMIDNFNKEFGDKTIDNLKQNIGKLQENAKNMDSKRVYPYWEANYTQDVAMIEKAINAAMNNIKKGKVDDYSWAEDMIGKENLKMIETRDGDLREYLKNYFRCGKPGVLKSGSMTVTLTGDECVKLIEPMITYVSKYKSVTSSFANRITNRYKTSTMTIDTIANNKAVVQNIKANAEESSKTTSSNANEKEQPAKESIMVTPSTYLMVEDRMVCETYLPFMLNYDSIMEAAPETQNNNGTSGNQGTTTDTKPKESSVDKSKGEVGAGKIESADTNKNTTKPNEKESTPSPLKKSDEATLTTDSLIQDYLKNFQYFFELATAAYQTALEERFLVYTQILKEVGNDYFIKTDEKEKEEKEADKAENNGAEVTDKSKEINIPKDKNSEK